MNQKAKNVEEIFALYERFGAADYIGEPVSQLEHMSQAAQLAIRQGYDDEVVLAAFFHDLGHLCVQEKPGLETMNGFGVRRHEQIGAEFLRSKGFSPRMARLVEGHVEAKRYLTFRNPSYYNNLSEASKETLKFQGGVMSESEAEAFEQDAYFELMITMRQWDEQAKETGLAIIDLDDLKRRALQLLEKN